MIRNTRLYVALTAFSAVGFGALAIVWAIRGHSYVPFLPAWSQSALYAALSLGFFYQIYHRLQYGTPESIAGLTDRQLWIIRGVAIASLLIFAAVVVWARFR